MLSMRHRGRIVRGRFVADSRRKWEIDQELLEGKSVTVELKPDRMADTSSLDDYYFGYIVGEVASSLEEFADCYSRAEVHRKLMEAITGRYVLVQDKGSDGLRIYRDSYTRYTYAERVIYVEKVKAFLCVECGVTLNY